MRKFGLNTRCCSLEVDYKTGATAQKKTRWQKFDKTDARWRHISLRARKKKRFQNVAPPPNIYDQKKTNKTKRATAPTRFSVVEFLQGLPTLASSRSSEMLNGRSWFAVSSYWSIDCRRVSHQFSSLDRSASVDFLEMRFSWKYC